MPIYLDKDLIRNFKSNLKAINTIVCLDLFWAKERAHYFIVIVVVVAAIYYERDQE